MKLALGLLIASVALAVLAVPAQAGTYDVWSCRLPNGLPAPTAGWHYEGWGPPPDGCSASLGMQATFPSSTLVARATVGWRFDAPAQTTIDNYELYRAAQVGTGSDGTSRAYALYHDVPAFDPLVSLFEFCASLSVAPCTEVGDPGATSPMDPDNAVARTGLQAKKLFLRMECRAAGEWRDCGPSSIAGSLMIGRARIGLSDSVAPTLAPPTGSLAVPGALVEGPQGMTVTGSDDGGGVSRFAVVVDGTTVVEESLHDRYPSCRKPFVDLVPCPRSTTLTFAFDTEKVTNGLHSVQLAAIDAAGNRTLSAPANVTVLNGATPNGVRASRGAAITAAFDLPRKPSRSDHTTVGFGERRAVRGRLSDVEGRPIGGAKIDVMATPLQSGAKSEQEGQLVTRADGRFRYLPRRGPARRLEFDYRAFSLDPDPSVTAVVVLKVRAGVRLVVRPRRTTSRGSIRFRGRLLGRPGRSGLQVALYAVGRRGRGRVPVSILHTDAKGRFRFTYSFVRTFAPFTYRFQARLERQPTYPYSAASSKRVVVRVVR